MNASEQVMWEQATGYDEEVEGVDDAQVRFVVSLRQPLRKE